ALSDACRRWFAVRGAAGGSPSRDGVRRSANRWRASRLVSQRPPSLMASRRTNSPDGDFAPFNTQRRTQPSVGRAPPRPGGSKFAAWASESVDSQVMSSMAVELRERMFYGPFSQLKCGLVSGACQVLLPDKGRKLDEVAGPVTTEVACLYQSGQSVAEVRIVFVIQLIRDLLSAGRFAGLGDLLRCRLNDRLLSLGQTANRGTQARSRFMGVLYSAGRQRIIPIAVQGERLHHLFEASAA